ncbi:hypothetical protein CBOM_06408 [Ceraceosorus bombacis]|uniref:Uncharacterized protein n=1 Tax=Ceraceosorus bombacis TaxID=401625 RepID=A0A0P1BJM4_9BASI|nr:hypothetical protein CBOM_06408 [Ceraceosorus bombacis]
MPGSRFMTGGPQTFRAQHSSDQAMRHMEEEQWRRQQMQETILAQRRARRHSIESAEYEQRGQTMQQRPSYVRDGYGSSRERRHSIDPAEQSRTYHLPGPPPFQGPAPSSASRPYRSHVSHFNQPYIVEPARSRRDTMQGGARAYQGPPQMQGSPDVWARRSDSGPISTS